MISDQTWMFEIEKHVFSLHVMIFFFVDVFKNSFTSILKILRTLYNLRHSELEYLVPSKWDLTCYIKQDLKSILQVRSYFVVTKYSGSGTVDKVLAGPICYYKVRIR